MWTAITGAALAVRINVGRHLEVTPTQFMGQRSLGWPVGSALVAGCAAVAGTALLSAADASRVALLVTVLLRLLLVATAAWTAAAIVRMVRVACDEPPHQS
jgi:hypothetical protein